MKKILFTLIVSLSIQGLFAQKHHEYNQQRMDLYFVEDISTKNLQPIILAQQNTSFWTQEVNAEVRIMVNKLIQPVTSGGDPRLQEVARGILSITGKKVEFYIFNDLGLQQGVNLNPYWKDYSFCPDGDDPRKSWPCGVSSMKQNLAGIIGIGNYFLSVAAEDRIYSFHDQLYLYETFIHELTHTQFITPSEKTLGKIHFYGEDEDHYLREMLPSRNAAFDEAIANAFAMRYHKSSTWWTQKPSLPPNRVAAANRPNKPLPTPPTNAGPTNKPLPIPPDQLKVPNKPLPVPPTQSAPPNKPLPIPPDQLKVPNKPLPVPPTQSAPPNKPLSIRKAGISNGSNSSNQQPEQASIDYDINQSKKRHIRYNENYDVLTWFNHDINLFADVLSECDKPLNANSRHCLINRLQKQNITGRDSKMNNTIIKKYSILELPPSFLLQNEMVQANIFNDFMTVFNSSSIMTQSVRNGLGIFNTGSQTTFRNAFGRVFKEMVKSAAAHKNLSNSPHRGKYMPLAILDFYTGFKIDSKKALNRALGGVWTVADPKIDSYFTEIRPILINYWRQNNGIWDRAILVKLSKDLGLNPRVTIGRRSARN